MVDPELNFQSWRVYTIHVLVKLWKVYHCWVHLFFRIWSSFKNEDRHSASAKSIGRKLRQAGAPGMEDDYFGGDEPEGLALRT